MDDTAIRALLARLARPHTSGGAVVERAALLAAGSDFALVIAWIGDHGGQPETTAAATPVQGLHGARTSRSRSSETSQPRRYVLPSGVLTA